MTILQYFHHMDQDVTLAINAWNTPFTDALWQLFSDKLVWVPFYALVVFFLFKKLGWKKALVCTVAFALTLVACDQLGNLVKNSVQRLRPCWDQGMVQRGIRVLEDKGGKFGFYSSHAANAMGFAMCSYKLFKLVPGRKYYPYGYVAFSWAVLVGLSRVFVGKHFFGDVCAGFVVGLCVGYAFAELSRLIIKRFSL